MKVIHKRSSSFAYVSHALSWLASCQRVIESLSMGDHSIPLALKAHPDYSDRIIPKLNGFKV